MSRDDFSGKVKEQLQQRVASRCSNPDCRVPTIAPSGSDGGVNNIGKAAHITAAASLGPRYDSSLTSNQRSSFENGIWLCAICADKIDRDTEIYTIALLREWKEKAEQTAREEHGKRLPAISDTKDILQMAFNGYPKQFIANAIGNIHHASCEALELVDPRFHVETSYIKGQTIVEVRAKENVPFTINVCAEKRDEFVRKIRDMHDHGLDLEIEATGISMEGSELYRVLNSQIQSSVFQITPKRRKAIQKLWLVQVGTNIEYSVGDIYGHITSGSKSFTFNGDAYEGLLKLTYRCPLDGSSDVFSMTLAVDWNRWDGIYINDLPYFEKLLAFYSRITKDFTLYVSLEVEGREVLKTKTNKFGDDEGPAQADEFLQYLHWCRTIANYLRVQPKFCPDYSCTEDEFNVIREVATSPRIQ